MSALPPLRLAAGTSAPATAAPVLEARGLAMGFGRGLGRVEVVRGCDLVLPAGALTLIRGPSGCGKSTLLAMLAGLTRPDAGAVRLGRSPCEISPTGRATRCGSRGWALCSRARSCCPGSRRWSRWPSCCARWRARAALEAVGLRGRAGARPSALSGGEQQRVALALAKAPRLVFADEPTSALDGEAASRVAGLLRDLVRREGAAVACVTHDDRLTPFADRVLRMEAGRLLEDARG